MEWIGDANGNRCSVEYFGSREAAQKALDSLKNCSDCSDCFDCSGCSDCSGCFGCSDCSDCSDCSRCSRCSDCSGCSRCFDCSRCSRCSGCSGCSVCSGCSDCSDCYDCSRCSGCYDLRHSKSVKAEAGKSWFDVPVIKNLHTLLLLAVEQPNALDMGTWHTCETTHCRAGWVVTLAGEKGKALENSSSTLFAAMQICRASSPIKVSPVRFFETNEVAMADIRRCAAEEQASSK